MVLSCTTDSSFFVDNASSLYNATDAPWGQSETQYFVSVDGVKSRRIVFAVLYGSSVQPQIAIRPVFGNEWLLDWTYIPITTPPQKYSLPLADGLSQVSTSWYSKDQFDQVHVHGAISAGSGSFSRDMIVATLPEGYRPATRIECPATFLDTSTSVAIAGAVAVNPDGTIWSFPDIKKGAIGRARQYHIKNSLIWRAHISQVGRLIRLRCRFLLC